LKLNTTHREDHQVVITAEFDTEMFAKYKARAAKTIAQEAKIPGFRPGKAPIDVIRRVFGDETISQKAIELLVDDVYPQIISESGIDPAGPGKLEKIISVDPPQFEFLIPLAPEVNLGDYLSIRQEYTLEPVTEGEIEETINRIRRSSAKTEEVSRPAGEGDQVAAVISARIINPEEGESDIFIRQNNFTFTIGDKDDTWPYAGFANQFIGMTKGEEKIFTYQYPDDASIQRVRGKEVEFKIRVESVNEMKLPELNDDFAKSVGEFESYEKLRDTIQQHLSDEKQKKYNRDYFNSLTDKLVSQSTIKYPPSLIEEEIKDIFNELSEDLNRQKLDLDTYLKLRNISKEKFTEEEIRPAAIKRLERSLAIEQFAKQEGIQISEDDIKSLYNMSLDRILNSPEHKIGKKKETEQLARSIAVSSAYQMLNQRINERLKEIATQTLTSSDESEIDPNIDTSISEELAKEEPTVDEAKNQDGQE